MSLRHLIVSIALLVLGLAGALGGVVVLVKFGKLDATSTMGMVGVGLLVAGLACVAASGGVWRAGGGGKIGMSRRSERIGRMLD